MTHCGAGLTKNLCICSKLVFCSTWPSIMLASQVQPETQDTSALPICSYDLGTHARTRARTKGAGSGGPHDGGRVHSEARQRVPKHSLQVDQFHQRSRLTATVA